MLLPCWYCGTMIDSKLMYCSRCRKAIKKGGIVAKRIKYKTINEHRGWFESKYSFENENMSGLKIWLYVDEAYGIIGRNISGKIIAEKTFFAKGKHKLLIMAKKALEELGVSFDEENRTKRTGLHQYAVKSGGPSKTKQGNE